MPLYLILFARLLPILVKHSLNLFTISYLSLTMESESIKCMANDLLALCLDRISFIVYHVILYHILNDSNICHSRVVCIAKTCF